MIKFFKIFLSISDQLFCSTKSSKLVKSTIVKILTCLFCDRVGTIL
nr:MAG TPA: hypothetical protein [Caudoviricetes sp.]